MKNSVAVSISDRGDDVGEQQTLDPALSADGKRNRFYLRCTVVGHSRSYAVCLNLCQERKNGRLNAVYAECSAAIGKKLCPALSMRKEEKTAGRAIYFVDRKTSPVETQGSSGEVISKPALPKKARKSLIERIDTAGYSEVVKTEVFAAKAVAAPVGITAKPGESLIEMARRMMGK